MSFEDLWDQVDLVNHHSELRREGVEDLVDLLKSRAALELKYHQGLDKLSHSPKCVSRSGTMAEAVSALKTHWQHRATQGKAMAALLAAEVVKPLELLLTHQSPLARAQAKESKILEKSLLQKTEKYEKTRHRYEKQSREAESLAEALSGTEPAKGKVRSKLALAKLEVDVAFEQCVSALEELNSSRQQHLSSLVICTQKGLLLAYQVQDKLRAHQMKQCLSKVIELETSCLESYNEFEEIKQCVAAIDPTNDQTSFVNEHKSTASLQDRVTFRPYESAHPLFREGPVLTEDWTETLSSLLEEEKDEFMQSVWIGEEPAPLLTAQVCVHS